MLRISWGWIEQLRSIGGRVSTVVSVWLAEADRARVAQQAAGTTITEWLSRVGSADRKEAAGILNQGRALLGQPLLKAAAASGQVTPGQVRGIGRTLRELPDELTGQQRRQALESLLFKAEDMLPDQLGKQAKVVTAELLPECVAGPEAEVRLVEQQRRRAVQRRSVRFFHDGDGSWRFEGSLPMVEGERFRKLVAGYVASRGSRTDRNRDDRTWEQKNADGLIALIDAHGSNASLPTLAGDRPRVVVTMRFEDLQARAEQAGVLPNGHRVDPGTLRRLCCDAEITPMVLGSISEVLDVGEAERTVTPAMRLALSVRDGGCRFPQCDAPDEVCHAHHVTPWWRRRRTAVEDLVLLCPHHHGLVEPPRFWTGPPPARWTVAMVEEQPVFTEPHGQPGSVDGPGLLDTG